jgi:hypothetical protein
MIRVGQVYMDIESYMLEVKQLQHERIFSGKHSETEASVDNKQMSWQRSVYENKET